MAENQNADSNPVMAAAIEAANADAAKQAAHTPRSESEAAANVADLFRKLGGDAGAGDDGAAPPPADAGGRPSPPPSAATDKEPDAEGAEEIPTSDLGIEPTSSGESVDAVDGLSTLAERLGMSMEELYATEVGLAVDAEPVTLGALKDAYQDAQTFEAERAAFADHRTAAENELLRARGELQEVMSLLGELPEGALEYGRRAYAARLDAERERLLLVKPEWADPDQYAAAKSKMAETLARYGISRAELDGIVDHRVLKAVWDYGELLARTESANAEKKRLLREHRTSRSSKPGGTQPQPAQTLPENPSQEQRVSAIANLLRS